MGEILLSYLCAVEVWVYEMVLYPKLLLDGYWQTAFAKRLKRDYCIVLIHHLCPLDEMNPLYLDLWRYKDIYLRTLVDFDKRFLHPF
jgi:hypothetical protein